jgi:hypothetical protein
MGGNKSLNEALKLEAVEAAATSWALQEWMTGMLAVWEHWSRQQRTDEVDDQDLGN